MSAQKHHINEEFSYITYKFQNNKCTNSALHTLKITHGTLIFNINFTVAFGLLQTYGLTHSFKAEIRTLKSTQNDFTKKRITFIQNTSTDKYKNKDDQSL